MANCSPEAVETGWKQWNGFLHVLQVPWSMLCCCNRVFETEWFPKARDSFLMDLESGNQRWRGPQGGRTYLLIISWWKVESKRIRQWEWYELTSFLKLTLGITNLLPWRCKSSSLECILSWCHHFLTVLPLNTIELWEALSVNSRGRWGIVSTKIKIQKNPLKIKITWSYSEIK